MNIFFITASFFSLGRYSLQSKGLIVIQMHLGTWWCIEASSGLSSQLFKKVDIRYSKLHILPFSNIFLSIVKLWLLGQSHQTDWHLAKSIRNSAVWSSVPHTQWVLRLHICTNWENMSDGHIAIGETLKGTTIRC